MGDIPIWEEGTLRQETAPNLARFIDNLIRQIAKLLFIR